MGKSAPIPTRDGTVGGPNFPHAPPSSTIPAMTTVRVLRLHLLLALASLACTDRPAGPAAAKVRWETPADPATEPAVRRIAADLTASGVALRAAQDPELRRAWPDLVGRRMTDTETEADLLRAVREECTAEVNAVSGEVAIRCTRPDMAGVALVNGLARAFVPTAQTTIAADIVALKPPVQKAVDDLRRAKADLFAKKQALAVDPSPGDGPPNPKLPTLAEMRRQFAALDEQITAINRDYDVKYSELQDLINRQRQFGLKPQLVVSQTAGSNP